MKHKIDYEYDGLIFDGEKRIGYRITDSKVLNNDGLRYYCCFFDEKENNIGGCAGYAVSGNWSPISPKDIEKLYFELKKNKKLKSY